MEAKRHIEYSIVVPVFNGALAVPELCERIIASLDNHEFEIILVDDASKDGSWDIILQLKSRYHFVQAIRHGVNRGQTAALLSGFNISRGRYVITIDDDLQYDPIDMLALIREQERTGADLIYGLPLRPSHTGWRKLLRSGIKGMGRLMGYRIKGSSFRLLKKEVVERLITDDPRPGMLLDILFYRSAFSIASVSVPHYKRKYGRSNYGLPRLVSLFCRSFAAYFALLFLNRHQKPYGNQPR